MTEISRDFELDFIIPNGQVRFDGERIRFRGFCEVLSVLFRRAVGLGATEHSLLYLHKLSQVKLSYDFFVNFASGDSDVT